MTDQPGQPDPGLQPPPEPAAEPAAPAPEPAAPPAPDAAAIAAAAAAAPAAAAAAAAAPPAPPAPPAYAPPPPPAAAPPQQTWVQPAAAAPAAAPAAVGWVAPPAAEAPKGRVTILARFAGLLLLLIGVFWGVVGVGFVAGGQVLKGLVDPAQVPGLGDAVGTAFAAIGIVFIFFAFWEILGGIGAIAGKGWGRWIGIIYSLLFGIASLLSLSGTTRAASDTSSDAMPVLAFFGAHVIAYIFIFVVLAIRWRGKAPSAA
ncbi:MAG TPA: hypothetical protein VEG29_06480 [Candidatus Binatia bacterium]|nr:hypothetical protein [Candidatus Binatia bacterium]